MSKTIPAFLTVLVFALTNQSARAGSATWSANPISGDWNTAANWTPNTVPNGPNDVATFAASNQTDVTISASTEVNQLIFSPGASDFTISVTEGKSFTISGTGITNNSGIDQNFVIEKTGHLDLTNSATAGELTFFILLGGAKTFEGGGAIFFSGTSSAGNGTFVVNGAANNLGNGASVGFGDNATAANGTFTAKAGGQSNVASSLIFFVGTSTAGDASFVIEGAGTGAAVAFFGSELAKPTAGNAIFNINGSSMPGGFGGFAQFSGGTAGSATFVTNPGTNGGGGGYIDFLVDDESDARFELFGGALFAEFQGDDATLGVGSIEGNALIAFTGLGTHQKLITGRNNLSTTFSGMITDFGSPFGTGALEKIGNGTLTLSGANTYTGGTRINGGTLLATNLIRSATGSGDVQLSGGTLGRGGTVSGAITVGTGSGVGGVLDPAATDKKIVILVTRSSLTLESDAIYRCTIDFKNSKATAVKANGITLSNGPTIVLKNVRYGTLAQGKVFKIISNTSANPISGTFSNLADGTIVNVGGTNFQADYQGGDGNDLTVTVVP